MADYTFIDRKYAYDNPRAATVTDAVVFRFDGRRLHLLLMERRHDPYKGSWALPGCHMDIEETLDQCCRRFLVDEIGIKNAESVYMKQVGTFSAMDRDPRGRCLSTAYYVLVRDEQVKAGDHVGELRWFPLDEVLEKTKEGITHRTRTPEMILAFDHLRVLKVAIQRLREDMFFRPVAFELLNEKFTIPDAQRLYEQLLGKTLDRRNFREKLLRLGLACPTGEKEISHVHKCVQLFTFDQTAYANMKYDDITDMEF